MPGSLAIPSVFAGNSPSAVSKLDTDLSTIASYINVREVTQGTIAARPAAGTPGAWYLATNINGGTLFADNGTAWTQVAAAIGGSIVYTDQLTGLGLSVSSGTILAIAAGAAASQDAVIANRVLMTLGAFTKSTAAWAAGTANGGLATGVAVAASTWYHVFLIQRTDTAAVDVAFDTSVTGANIAANTNANYTKLRRLGSFKTDGAAAILSFTQDGDYFRWAASVLDVSSAPGSTAAVTATLASVPPGIKVDALFNGLLVLGANSCTLYFSDLSANDELPITINAAAAVPGATMGSGVANVNAFQQLVIRTNTSAQIRYRVSSITGGPTVAVITLGWFDRRGRG